MGNLEKVADLLEFSKVSVSAHNKIGLASAERFLK